MTAWTNIPNTTPATATGTEAMDPVAWLLHDHQIIKALLDEVAGTDARRLDSLERFKRLLALHNAIEENLVYPMVAKIASRREVAMELFHQTAEADVLVYTLNLAALTGNEAGYTEAAMQLKDALLAHVHKEETEIFPLLEAASDGEKRMLAQQILQFRQSMVAA